MTTLSTVALPLTTIILGRCLLKEVTKTIFVRKQWRNYPHAFG